MSCAMHFSGAAIFSYWLRIGFYKATTSEIAREEPMADFTKQKTFTVTMDYLREVVAKHTFRDSPAAALRELIQNAHDACLIRSAHDGHQDLSVHITLDPVDKKITIEDTG